ncbi:MAG: hypothetical protein HC772_17615 [Leptolyngbyaceae cyanobacterium CRU_2_3]|nr:hypothetical protein [Leptolyngbyaceae cyanobacterium CRU_2_3]
MSKSAECSSLSLRRLVMVLGLLSPFGLFSALIHHPALALPGQSVEEVAGWIQTHPTLQPESGETLLVRKSDTPARRFTFEALTTSPGRAANNLSSSIIRTERISLFDTTNGVSRDRLEDSLRVIYGDDIYQDYQQAQVVYQYPTPQMLSEAQNQAAPLRGSIQGEIRQGGRFAYLTETVQTLSGEAYTGQISIFLIEDVNKLEVELQGR